jgi:hypothetical protein
MLSVARIVMSKNGRDRIRTYRVRFRELGKGRDGGLGDVKSCKMSLRQPNQASGKLKKRATVISVREIKKN